jgi:bacteriorhodopsin
VLVLIVHASCAAVTHPACTDTGIIASPPDWIWIPVAVAVIVIVIFAAVMTHRGR